MKPKLTPDFIRGFKRALMRVYGLNVKWTTVEQSWRKDVLHQISGKKRNPRCKR